MSPAVTARSAPRAAMADGSPGPVPAELPDRSRTMYLIYEDLARAHCQERMAEAERVRRASRILAAKRTARRAQRAALRARRARALASIL